LILFILYNYWLQGHLDGSLIMSVTLAAFFVISSSSDLPPRCLTRQHGYLHHPC
jgi:hypothetical protein